MHFQSFYSSQWPKLCRIDLGMIQLIDYGKDSKEKDIQKHREMVVLAEIYFDKNMVPETPFEPDPESYNPEEPKKIPLEDVSIRMNQLTGQLVVMHGQLWLPLGQAVIFYT